MEGISTPALDALNPRQRRFVLEYCGGTANGQEAARKAGYSWDNAKVVASRLLTRDDIQAALREVRESLEGELIADLRELAETLTEITRARVSDYLEVDEKGFPRFSLDRIKTLNSAAVESIKLAYDNRSGQPSVTLTLAKKTAAVDALFRVLGIGTEPPPPQVYNIQLPPGFDSEPARDDEEIHL